MSSAFHLSYGALWALVVFQSLILLGLTRAVYRLERTARLGGPPIESTEDILGHEAPNFSGIDIHGMRFDSSVMFGRAVALLFVAPDCSTCTVSLQEMEALSTKARGNVVVLCRSGGDECRRMAEEYSLDVPVLVDEDGEISRLFGGVAPPTAVLVNPDGRIKSVGQPMKPAELERLVEEGELTPALQETP